MLSQDYSDLDPNSGYLCSWLYWRPDPTQPDPEMPGLKQMVITYLPTAPQDHCLCGSIQRKIEERQTDDYFSFVCIFWQTPEIYRLPCTLASAYPVMVGDCPTIIAYIP